MKKFSFLLISLAFYCSSTSLVASIKVGTVFFYPPFVLSPGSGFDIDLSKVLCQRLQEQCQFIPMNFNQLFSALNAHQIDIAIGGISISNMQTGNYIFSLPYMLSKGQFLVLKNGPLNSILELEGKIVGVIRGEGTGGLF